MDGTFRVDDWDTKHLALACFADPQQGDLRRVGFTRLLPLEEPAEGARIVLKSGERLVAAEIPVGRGRCLYFGTTADRDWTDLPRTRMYVPLVRQFLAYLTDQLTARAAVTDRLVTLPEDKIGIVPVAGEDGRWTVTNLDPRESVLNRMTPEELHVGLGGSAEKAEDEARQAALKIVVPPDALRADEFWTTVAWILLLVLAAETLLASRVHA